MVSSGPTDDSSESVSEAIIETVAEAEGLDPLQLDPPLGTELDPDALDQLFRSNATGPTTSVEHVTLTYHGYEVTAFSDGRIITQELG